MIQRLVEFFQERSWAELARDALDVFIVYYLVYRALLVVRGTRAIQVGFGLAAVFLLYIVAQRLQLSTVSSVLGALIADIILVIVVVFQNDIRRGLMRLGRGASFGRGARSAETQVIEEVVEAATELARHRIGAIITFEKEANLDEFVEPNHKGIVLDAAVSRELLVSLFVPEGSNKLHDGAVIIRSLRIAKAGVFFPMGAAGKKLDSKYGSRHRAALGITDETDAVVVVVSEERGTISYCFGGNIIPAVPVQELRKQLEAALGPKKKSSLGERLSKTPPPPSASPPTSGAAARASSPSRVSSSRPLRDRGSDVTDEPAPVSIRVTEPGDRRDAAPPPPLRPSVGASKSEPPPPLRPRPAPSKEVDEGAEVPPPLREQVLIQNKPDSDRPAPLRPPATDKAPASQPAAGSGSGSRLGAAESPKDAPLQPAGTPLPATQLLSPDTTPVPLSRRPSALETSDDDAPPSTPGGGEPGAGSGP